MSATPTAEPEGVVSKVKVKKQIKTIVKDLETILGDLKDVAKELKEVVHEIDSLTSDLQLEEEMTDSSKTDTLNSSSSSTTTTTTASSIDKSKLYPEDATFRPLLAICPPAPTTVLTVLRKPHPPLPPPRLTPLKADDHQGRNGPLASWNLLSKTNGTLMRNGGGMIRETSCFLTGSCPDEPLVPLPLPMPLLRHDKTRCPQATRERVRFSETVQYHGYCHDCDLQYEVDDTDAHLPEPPDARLSPVHRCSSPERPLQLALENGRLPLSRGFPPTLAPPPPCVPPRQPSVKPQKTILRKSTTTTV
ncbi:protein Largen [Osmerus eperlanus]|uniref:protein Largen n=1 Tax=Osmerus eperlanus TaxID=29151 RepID=UPI002E10DD30